MRETDYTEPLHVLLDWRKQNQPFTEEESRFVDKTIDDTERQIIAYAGYPDIQEDATIDGLAKLEALRVTVAGHVAKVVPIRTVYVVTSSPVREQA